VKVIIAFFSVLLMLGFAFMFFKKTKDNSSGIVVVLNGPSGSGKSSIQKEFQKLHMPNLWIKVGIDNLFDNVMPEITPENMSFWQSKNPIRWVEKKKDDKGNDIVPLFVGEQGDKVFYAMNSCIAEYAKNGCNVIVDYIAYKKDMLSDLKEKLKNVESYFVAVQISLDVLEQREANRGTSPKGHARSHYFTVYGDMKYDLTVNSEKNSPKEIAQQIKNFIEK